MDYIDTIIQTTYQSFDFTFCIIVNVLTYVAINTIEDYRGTKLKVWYKRLVTIGAVLVVSIVYYFTGMNVKLLFNSAILAPVFWSWIGKPLVKVIENKFNKGE